MLPVGSGATPPSLPGLPNGWTAYTDPKTSRTYYVHLPTGDTQWTRPPPPPPPPAAPAQQYHHPIPQQFQHQPSAQVQQPYTVTSQPQPQQLQPFQPQQPQPYSVPSMSQLPQPQNQQQPYSTVQNIPYQSPSYAITPTTPQSVQSQPPHNYNYNAQGTNSNGWNNAGQNQSHSNRPPFNRNNIILGPPPPNLPTTHNALWQAKRLRPQSFNSYQQYPPAKRSRPQRALINDINNNTNIKKDCSKCGLMKGWDAYSKRQWNSFDAVRKCKACVTETVKANELSQLENATPEKEKSKICSACGENLLWELFSKRQWTTKDELRKCRACVDKCIEENVAEAKLESDQLKDEANDGEVKSVSEEKEGDGESNSNMKKKCSSCGVISSEESFSKRQWGTSYSSRKCKLCMDKFLASDAAKVLPPGQSSGDRKDGGDNGNSDVYATNGHLKKICSSCGENRPKESFSKRQWGGIRQDLRKCKLCMDKVLARDTVEKSAALKTVDDEMETLLNQQPNDKVSESQNTAAETHDPPVENSIKGQKSDALPETQLDEPVEKFTEEAEEDGPSESSHVADDSLKNSVVAPEPISQAVPEAQLEQSVEKVAEAAKEDGVSESRHAREDSEANGVAETETIRQDVSHVSDALIIEGLITLSGHSAEMQPEPHSTCKKNLSNSEGESHCENGNIHHNTKIEHASMNHVRQVAIKEEPDL